MKDIGGRKTLRGFTYIAGIVTLLVTLGVPDASAFQRQRGATYEVTITNLTRDQQFTPILVVSHDEGYRLFEAGTPAGPDMEALAENGDLGPLMTALPGTRGIFDIAASSGLLDPGASVSVWIRGGVGRARSFSVASMLIPTNDGFFGVTGASLPVGQRSSTYFSPVYDAGTERNDETCASIPGPDFVECGGPGSGGAPAGDEEGFVHVHAGIHGIGDFVESERDWRNPAARITVRRIR